MGNTSSRAPSIITSSSGVKVLAPFTGALKVYTKPIKTSDVLLSLHGHSAAASHFVTDSTSLEIGHRVAAVHHDQILRPRRELYLVLPTDMLFSVLTQEELALISHKAAQALTLHHNVHRYNHLRRIFPVCVVPTERRRNSAVKDDGDGDGEEGDIGGFVVLEETQEEMKHCSWRPALETIVES